jgi:hypothetical protein
MVLTAIVGIILMCITQGCNNRTLLLLLLTSLLFAVTTATTTFWIPYYRDTKYVICFAVAVAVSFAASNACHWIITQTYFRVSFETRLLVDKQTYSDGAN